MTRRFGLPSNSRGADKIKDLPISIDFRNRITELLRLFNIISPWFYISKIFCKVRESCMMKFILLNLETIVTRQVLISQTDYTTFSEISKSIKWW